RSAGDPARSGSRQSQRSAVGARDVVAEAREDHALDSVLLVEKAPRLSDRDLDRLLQRIAIGATTDSRKGDAANAVFQRQAKTVAVTGGEKFRLVARSAAADRPRGVNDILRRQSVAARDPRLAGRPPSDRAALRQKLRSRGAVDRAIDAPAAKQSRVRSVDDG